MSAPRLSGSFFGQSVRFWLVLCVGLIVSLSTYHYIGELNSRLDILLSSRVKLEKAVTKLQLDSIDVSRRHLSFAEESHSERESSPDDDQIVVYNRVPKTGSTTLAGITYELCSRNHFHVIHMNITKNQRTLGLSDQLRFVSNITSWEDKKPALYHGHVAFIDFSRFGLRKQPIYINMVRDPLDRLISYYYFVRYGDDFKPDLKRRKAGDHETFDECVERDGEDCDPENLWVQIPYFCGHHADCWEPGNQWALAEAKSNVIHHYLVVGATEEMGDFLMVLEATLPRFFRGASQLYNNGQKSHLRRTTKKLTPKQDTVDKIQESDIWRMEKEFYDFVLDHFRYIRHLTFDLQDGETQERGRRFHFEKIRPR